MTGRFISASGWAPQHKSFDDLATIIAGLKRDPVAWSEANKIDSPLAVR